GVDDATDDVLVAQNSTSTSCGLPIRDEYQATKITRLVLLLALPTLAIVLRMTVKLARVASWGADDAIIFLAYKNGAGRDIWTLSFGQIDRYFMGFYIAQCLYHIAMMLIKSSILFTFLRIFPGDKFRLLLWVTQAINLVIGLTFILLGIFQCQPISLAWKFWDQEHDGHCISIKYIGIAHSSLNICLDVWMLIMPATQIWMLKMQRRKRVSVIFMFSLGLFLTIVSGIRMKGLLAYNIGSRNPTSNWQLVDTHQTAVWSDIELYVGIFTACIPNIRQFFIRFILRRSDKTEGLSSLQAQDNKSTLKPPTQTPMENLDEVDCRL
ncbi:cfem domain-containing protein, partial [Colletotrichum incanum]